MRRDQSRVHGADRVALRLRLAEAVVLALWLLGSTSGHASDDPSVDHYVEPRSYGTKRESDPPAYVRNLSTTGLPGTKELDWLDLGLEQRTRYEFRRNDIRREVQVTDHPLLLRTRAYVGIRNILDPFRFTIELQDSRRYFSQFERDNRDVNTLEPLQAFGELYFANGLGEGRPVSIRGGRMAFEVLDRRLIARNEWRNTTNSFQGVRVTLGRDQNDWSADLLALQPLERLLTHVDRAVEDQWFYGAIGHYRGLSRWVTLEPYWFGLVQDGGGAGVVDREIHTVALRAYGPAGKTGFDYDVSGVFQGGEVGARVHRAWAATVDVGWTFDHAWKPRIGAFYGYVSGDRDPGDREDNRFDRLFGFSRPWSSNDYIQEENVNTPKLLLAFEPWKDVKIDTAYVVFWLASGSDRWNATGLSDPSGRSGRFLGHEYNFRARFPIASRIKANVGYAYFDPGRFPSRLGRNADSHFVYVELSLYACE
ncbi:alginate export family protein [Myxococcota bacterium]|nr:alginate export family protein [Myxococcota bacterium]